MYDKNIALELITTIGFTKRSDGFKRIGFSFYLFKEYELMFGVDDVMLTFNDDRTIDEYTWKNFSYKELIIFLKKEFRIYLRKEKIKKLLN